MLRLLFHYILLKLLFYQRKFPFCWQKFRKACYYHFANTNWEKPILLRHFLAKAKKSEWQGLTLFLIYLNHYLQSLWACATKPTWNDWINLSLLLTSSCRQKNIFITQLIFWDKADSLFVITLGMPKHAWLYPLEVISYICYFYECLVK